MCKKTMPVQAILRDPLYETNKHTIMPSLPNKKKQFPFAPEGPLFKRVSGSSVCEVTWIEVLFGIWKCHLFDLHRDVMFSTCEDVKPIDSLRSCVGRIWNRYRNVSSFTFHFHHLDRFGYHLKVQCITYNLVVQFFICLPAFVQAFVSRL